MKRLLWLLLLSASSLFSQTPPGAYGPSTGSSTGGGVVGGTFGASPSSGYTFTSTQITSSPFAGNLLVGTAINPSDASTYTAGSGWTLALGTGTTIGLEYQTAGAASSYSAAFTISPTQVWGGTITAFTATNPAFVQAKSAVAATLAYTSNNAAGNLLFAVVRYNSSLTGPVTGVTCNSNTWVLAGLRSIEAGIKGVGDNGVEEIWYAPNSNAGACTVTPSGVSGISVELGIAEFSGVATSSPLVDYNYNADGTGNTTTTSIAGATTNTQYTINAINNTTGKVDFTGRDWGAVFRSAAAPFASTGALFYRKIGVYPGLTSLHESVAGQTNWYVWGIPAPVVNKVSWHFVCESTPQYLSNSPSPDGCVDQIMPSAYSGPAPSGTQLSGFWQRPSATFGATGNNGVFFVNGVCRIPDNQRSATICYDTFTSNYSSHIGTVADTAIPATPLDQLCGGITPAAANITGYRTNQSSTNETYFENTWAVGYNTPYNSLSNHAIFINAHSLCNQNAGVLAVASSLYGGQLIHFQDNHNIAGLTFNCAAAGTRWDVQNMVREVETGGAFQTTTQATETTPGNCTGAVTITTGSANAVAFNPPNFFASGSGANFTKCESTKIICPGDVFADTTSAATTGTTKQILNTYTFIFQANGGTGVNNGPFLNNPGAVFRVKAWGITAANADSKTFEIDFGGTAIATMTSTANNGSIKCTAEIIVGTAANTQEIEGECVDSTGAKTFLRTTPGITGNANIALTIAATTPTASGDFTYKGRTVEVVSGN